MTRFGFHASHEQIDPAQLLVDVRHAESVGFDMAMCSDHIAPWSSRQGHSGNNWTWLGAVLATTAFPIGTLAIPGHRYHPVVLAHQLATLAQMFPDRVWAALGSGEAMNEHVTGARWPQKEERVSHLEESVDVIRRLLTGEEVSHHGSFTVDRARLWDVPEAPPLLLGPAISPPSAARVATWADGLVTVSQPAEVLRDVVTAYSDAGGTGRLAVQVHLSWAPTLQEAEALAHDQWRSNVFAPPVPADTMTTQAFDAMAEHVPEGVVTQTVRVSEDLGRHREWLAEFAELGFDDIYLHHVGQDQAAFIEIFGEQVLPAVRGVNDASN
ncbi:TIGR03885 family FMN-dependent LLM class oxidoreductase [Ornithinimicrobium cryptoxanthini]|uniref:TIGR03885 family FMN-dependent LLM class oxidoreductase n=1 Tax=Ornithinimicrobium cryptoxanthini TaxID=2934161 RepID=UPI0021181A0D|nr:TIGR03885 family FMN-dependent LLM class oxidoreductase [Ornithinimicrobium cryptoxanthini]